MALMADERRRLRLLRGLDRPERPGPLDGPVDPRPGPLRHRRRGARRSRPPTLDYDAGILASAPPVFPSGLLNRLVDPGASTRLWFRKAPKRPPRRAADDPDVLPPARHARRTGTGSTDPGASCSGSTSCRSAPRRPCATPSTASAPRAHARSCRCSSASAPATRAACRSRSRAGRSALDIPVGTPGLGAAARRARRARRRGRRPRLPGQGQPGAGRAAAGHVPAARRVARGPRAGRPAAPSCRATWPAACVCSELPVPDRGRAGLDPVPAGLRSAGPGRRGCRRCGSRSRPWPGGPRATPGGRCGPGRRPR